MGSLTSNRLVGRTRLSYHCMSSTLPNGVTNIYRHVIGEDLLSHGIYYRGYVEWHSLSRYVTPCSSENAGVNAAAALS